MERLRCNLEECRKELKRLEAETAATQLQLQVDERKSASKKSILLNIRGKGSSACLTANVDEDAVLARYRGTCGTLLAIAEEALASPAVTKGLEAAALQRKLEEKERTVADGVEKVTGHISTFTQVLLSIPLTHRMEVQTSLGHIIRDLQPLNGVAQRKRSSARSTHAGERPSERLKQKIAEKKRKKQALLEKNSLRFEAIAEDVGIHHLTKRDRSNTLAAFPMLPPPPEEVGVATREESSEKSCDDTKRHRMRRWKSELLLDSWDTPSFLREVSENVAACEEEVGETVVQEDADELKAILRRQRTIRKTLAVPSAVAPMAPLEQRDIAKRLTFVLTHSGQQLLVGGAIEDIWLWVIAKSGNEKDLCTFLMLYRPYTSAAVLVDVLDNFLDDDDSNVNEISLKRIQFGLSVWIKLFVEDFIKDQQAGNRLIGVIGKLEALLYPESHTLEMEGRSLKNVMRDNIATVLSERSVPSLREPMVLSPRSRDKREFLQLPCRDLARQLCMVEFEKFAKVVAADTISAKDRAASPTINALVTHFNRMSGWVSTEVVMNPNVKKRAAIVRGFIGLALACLQLRNYNAVLEIVAGLNQSVVQRLKKTWKLVSRKQLAALKQLELLMDPQGNYKAYRETIKTTKLPAVPYVGIYLKDATFIDEGNKDFLETGTANFEKMRMKAALISSIEFFQLRGYRFPVADDIVCYLQNVVVMDEKTAYKHSLQCEPRTVDL